MFSPQTRHPSGIAPAMRPCNALTHAREGWCAESSERACNPSAYSVVFSPSSFSVTTTSRPANPDRSPAVTSSAAFPGDHGRCGVRG
jgi:hypothetical protein